MSTADYLPALTESGRRWARFGGLLLVTALLVWLLVGLRAVFTPILGGLAIAYVLNPLVTWGERRGASRLLLIAGLYFFGTLLLLTLGTMLVAITIEQTLRLRESIGPLVEVVRTWIVEQGVALMEPAAATAPAAATGPAATAPATAAARDWFAEIAPLAKMHGLAVVNATLAFLAGLMTNVFNWVTLFVLLPMYTFFFLWRFNDFVATVRAHLPAPSRPTIVYVVTTIDRAIASFFRGRLIVCLVIGLLTGIGWTLVGVPFGFPLGALAGALNLVPFLTVLALPLALLASYFEAVQSGANWITPVVLATGVYLLVQALESFVLTPAIQARTAGLHPVTTVVALMIGAEWAGMLGMLLAIPFASTLKTLAQVYVLPELRRLAAQPVAVAESPPVGPPVGAGLKTSECDDV